MYVRDSVPQSDIDDFVKYITFEGEHVNAYRTGLGKVVDRIYKKYGGNVYGVLIDAYDYRQDKAKERRTKETAEAILPLIRKELTKKRQAVRYNERLIHEIWSAGYGLKEKTSENMTNFGSVYVFYLGYLLGAGKLQEGVKDGL